MVGASAASCGTRRKACVLSKENRALRRGVCAALGVALASFAAPLRAHAPPLGARVLSPAGGGDEVIVTNRGLVFRDPSTGSARLLCNEALRITTAELPSVALLGDGALLVASSSGLRLSRDQGCTWSDVGQMEYTNTPAMAPDPSDPDRAVIASYDTDAPGLRVTHDAGRSWSPLYANEEGDFVFSLLIAEADADTLYATVASYAPGAPAAHSLLRTRDGGQSWQRLPLPLNERDYSARLAAISPEDPETVVVYTTANSPGLDDSRLLVSQDGGATFRVALERPEIRGAGYGADGTLWVAARDGLYAGFDGGLDTPPDTGLDTGGAELGTFTQTSVASELGCVLERSGSLFVCGHYAGLGSASSGIGVSVDGGNSFERWLDFQAVDAAVECAPDSLTAALCARPWLDWEAEMSGMLPASTPGGYGPGGYGAGGDASGFGPGGGVSPSATQGATPGAMVPAGTAPGGLAPDGAASAGALEPEAGVSAGCTLHSSAPGAGSRGGGRVGGGGGGGGGGALVLAAAAWLCRSARRRRGRCCSRG